MRRLLGGAGVTHLEFHDQKIYGRFFLFPHGEINLRDLLNTEIFYVPILCLKYKLDNSCIVFLLET